MLSISLVIPEADVIMITEPECIHEYLGAPSVPLLSRFKNLTKFVGDPRSLQYAIDTSLINILGRDSLVF